jgi:hypothetical protein
MPNGTLKLYNKLTNALLVSLDILGTFNIEDNLNETPSNMKVKVITSNTYREEFQVNTVAFHEDTNSWWVIKSDESSYLTTGEYEHEIQLVEYLEFYAYRHLPNCAFAPNTYTLEQMLLRLFGIAKLSISVIYPDFLDKDKIMPFFSFENFTVANAIKNIARAINAIPKMSVNTTGFVPTLNFINRNGIDDPIKEVLNDWFPIAYEKNMNSNDQFTTRSVSNITNAKSSSLVVAPKSGGFKNVSPNSPTYVIADSKVLLPSKIDRIEFVRIFPPIKLIAFYKPTGITETIYESYYLNVSEYSQKLIAHPFSFRLPSGYTTAQKEAMANNLPNPLTYQEVNYNDNVDRNYNPSTSDFTDSLFFNKMSLLNKFEFDTLSKVVGGISTPDTDKKERTIHWNPFSEEMIMPLSFRNGLFGGNDEDHNRKYRLYNDSDYEVYLIPSYTTITTSPFAVNVVKNDQVLIQVGYYPIADIKVSVDNDNDAQDEKFFNQSGKVIDAVSVSKLITSHTNDSVEGTKIRNAKYESPDYDYTDILPLGQLVRDSNQIYVITQRSIDGMVKNSNEYYNVIYTLSRNRIARSENIVADSSVISFKTPDDNLVFRTQLYKDYIELSLQNFNQEAPYLSMSKALVLNENLAGINFDYTVLAKNSYGTTPTIVRYVKSPTTFDLHKAKLMNVNWQDNNVLGFRLDSTGSSYVQTPIVYTDDVGKATNFELLFLDTTNLNDAISDYNTPTVIDRLVPFRDLTQVPTSFYTDDVLADGRFSIRIQEDTSGGRPYQKDPFEIPVFEYMIQGNDDYNQLGNIVISNDLFSTFTGTLRYHYRIDNTTRFTAENADKLYGTAPTSTARRVIFTRDSGTPHIVDLDLFTTYTSPTTNIRNFSNITNIGIYATDGTTVKFLFAINDYSPLTGGINDNSNIRVFINNWKI